MSDGMTYGAELELADIDRRKPNCREHYWDERDFTMVNSNGIAVDPKGKLYPFGGEICMAPQKTPSSLTTEFGYIKRHYREAAVNYRSNLHIHVRVPGLKDDLNMLKQVQVGIHTYMPELLPIIEPIPKPFNSMRDEDQEWYEGALRRYRRRKVSHHTLLTPQRLMKQRMAQNITEFFRFEVPHTRDGKPMWHAQPRLCVNLRQLLETDTVEFRHFPGTLSDDEFYDCVSWCRNFLIMLIRGDNPMGLLQTRKWSFPKFPDYNHEMEKRYRLTCHDGTLKKEEIRDNIAAILAEDGVSPGFVPRQCKPKPTR